MPVYLVKVLARVRKRVLQVFKRRRYWRVCTLRSSLRIFNALSFKSERLTPAELLAHVRLAMRLVQLRVHATDGVWLRPRDMLVLVSREYLEPYASRLPARAFKTIAVVRPRSWGVTLDDVRVLVRSKDVEYILRERRAARLRRRRRLKPLERLRRRRAAEKREMIKKMYGIKKII